MVKTKTKKTSSKPVRRQVDARVSRDTAVASKELDGLFLLKLVLYLIIGSQWVRFTRGGMTIPIPIGVIVGVFFARTEKFQIDRKLEFVVLLMAMFIGFWVLPGIEVLL